MELFQHQTETVEAARGKSVRGIIADDTGTGKTRATIAVLEDEPERRLPAVIVCPKSVMQAWADEWKAYSGREVRVISSPHRVRERHKMIIEALQRGESVVTNYATLTLLAPRDVRKWPAKTVVFDEAHRLRDGTTKTHRRAVALASVAENVLLLTATPWERRPSDAWGLLAVVKPEVYNSKYRTWKDFVLQYEVTDFFGRYYRPKPKAEEVLAKEVQKACGGFFFARRKEDLLDLPPCITKHVRVAFEPRAMRLYTELSRGMCFLDDGTPLVPSTKLSQLQRMRILAETCTVEPFNCTPKGDNLKVEYVAELLRAGVQVVVFTEFKRVVDFLEEHLTSQGFSLGRITSDENQDERAENVRAFREGKIRAMLCTYGAGGEGINLQSASHLVVYGLPLSYTKYYQAVSRVWRAGSKKKVTIHVLRNLVPKGVIDVERRTWALIAEKKEFHVSMLDEWFKSNEKEGENELEKHRLRSA